MMMRMMMFLADDNDVEKAETEYSLRSDSFAWQAMFTVLDSYSSLTTMMIKIKKICSMVTATLIKIKIIWSVIFIYFNCTASKVIANTLRSQFFQVVLFVKPSCVEVGTRGS